MFKKSLLVLVLGLSTFNIAYSQVDNKNVIQLSSEQKNDIESAMNILKDIQDNHLLTDNINTLLEGYEVSTHVKYLVISHITQGLKYSDFDKLGYGNYVLAHDDNLKANPISNYVCSLATGVAMCSSFPGGVCQRKTPYVMECSL